MARQFKLARQFKNLKAVEAAELLGVSQAYFERMGNRA